MQKLIRMVILLCLLLDVVPVVAEAAGLRAGVAKVDITPPLGLKMYGYGGRKDGATRILDPLYARVLVLEAGDKRVALVVCDLGRPFAPAWIERLRENARNSSGISYVLTAAIHTHSGPEIPDEYPPLQGPDWETPVLEKISKAIADAHQNEVAMRRHIFEAKFVERFRQTAVALGVER